ncbi:MAG: TonB-dependent receptor [bacterium]|nr:TonB-dependent receptor [bacterium]
MPAKDFRASRLMSFEGLSTITDRGQRMFRNQELSKRVLVVLVAGWILSGGGLAAQTPAKESVQQGPLAGLPLDEALRALQDGGLKLFFTSNVVTPGMRVEAEPTAGDPRGRLDQLLAPHGLTSKVGPGDRLVVVAARPAVSSIHGNVRERLSETPLPGVRLVVVPSGAPRGDLETGQETISGAGGSFLLDELAAGSYTLEAHLPGFVVERFEQIRLAPGEVVEVRIRLQPAPMALDEIVVTPSFISLMQEEPVTGLTLDREDIFALPHLGNDIYRAFTLLPGVSGEEVSAKFNVRGGRTDEVLMLLDRVELYEPFHLKDYGSALSIVTPQALREVNLMTGGFPAEYGDRMSGVLDMTTVEVDRRHTLLGLSLLSAELGSTGTYDHQRGQWFASIRRGQLDLALQFLGQKQKPKYWDAFAKTEYQFRPEHRLGVHLLVSEDGLDFFNVDLGQDIEDYLTSYGNAYAWITHQGIIGSRLFADTTASLGRVDRDRNSQETDLEEDFEGNGFTLIDKRVLEAVGIKQDWNFQASDRHYLKWGFDVRRLSTDYDYFNERNLDDPLEEIRFEPRTGTTSYLAHLRSKQYSLYLSDRYRPACCGPIDALTLELGLRHDEHTLTGDANTSPRFNLVYAPGPASALRLSWGYFYQTQRPYELQVEDGIRSLASAERTEQRVIGFERTFKERSLLLRLEAYQRRITDPRPRYENVYQPVEIFPEIEPDRVSFAPESSESSGVEVFLRGTAGPRVDWWASYAYSRVEDSIDGASVPRRIDQPHAISFDVNTRAGKHWNVNLAWQYHTGWPITPLSAELEEDDELEPVAVLGPFNSERLPDYHRLDLRASREWQTRRGMLKFFIEIQNVYNRKNVAGFDPDFEFEEGADGEIDITIHREIWGEILPSFGITWQF